MNVRDLEAGPNHRVIDKGLFTKQTDTRGKQQQKELTEMRQLGKTTGTASDINWQNCCKGSSKTRQMERIEQGNIGLSSDNVTVHTAGRNEEHADEEILQNNSL